MFPFTVTIYAGGEFGSIGGQTRISLAALDGATGSATSWAPDPNSDVFSIAVQEEDQPPFPVTVFVGGQFAAVAGQSRSHIAALDESGAATPWNPGANASVFTLMANSSVVTTGGYFTSIGGQSRTAVAALSASTGSALPWNPDVSAGSVQALAAGSGWLYIGGLFQSVLGLPYTNFAGLSDAVVVGVSELPASPPLRPMAASPNPFYTNVAIRLTIPEAREADVGIFDLAGRLVRRLHRGTLHSGVQRFTWDGRDERGLAASAGVYFARLDAGELKQSTKVLLLR